MRFTVHIVATALAWSVPALAVQKNPPQAEIPAAEAAQQAIANLDTERLFGDKAYAASILASVDRLRGTDFYTGERRSALDGARMIALVALGRSQDAVNQANTILRDEPGNVNMHYLAFVTAVDIGGDAALRQLEQANALLSGSADRTEFADSIELEMMGFFRRPFHVAKDKAKLARSAELLMAFGLPGTNYPGMADSFRLDMADQKLATRDIEGARKLVHSIRSIDPVLITLVSRRWEAVRESGDPGERLAQAIAASDETSAQAMQNSPKDLKLVLGRAQYLRSVGKDQAALDLILPRIADLDWIKQNGEDAFWLVNESAYALRAVGRSKDAMAQMDRLMSIGLDSNYSLVSMAINKAEILNASGDHRGAASHAVMLATQHADKASPYGIMWMWEGAVCGYAFAGDRDAARPYLEKLKAGESDNPAALTRALLCANDGDGVAAAIIRRLDGKDPDDMLTALQDYQLGPAFTGVSSVLESRLRTIVARPDVAAAIARHGRIIKVPLSRIYWGMF